MVRRVVGRLCEITTSPSADPSRETRNEIEGAGLVPWRAGKSESRSSVSNSTNSPFIIRCLNFGGMGGGGGGVAW